MFQQLYRAHLAILPMEIFYAKESDSEVKPFIHCDLGIFAKGWHL
jgi:hypothetical protein